MKNMKRVLTLCLSIILCMSMVACSQQTATQGTNGDTTKQTGDSADASAVQNTSSTDVDLLNVGCIYQFDVESPYCDLIKYLSYDSFMYANLVRYDKNNEVVPCLCKDFKIADDGTAVTFYFKEGIKWHDGQPLTMEDIEFSLNMWLDVLKPSVALRYMKSVEVLDDTSIRVNMQSSCAYVFLRHMIMSSSGCVIYPKHIWENVAQNVDDLKSFTGKEAMIGCGPYAYDSYDETSKTVYFNRFEDYHEGVPAIKRIAFKLYESPEALAMAYKNQEIDCMYQYAAGLSGTYISSLSDLNYLDIGQEINLGGPILEFNFKDTLMDDSTIRNAVYNALDYELIASTDGDQYCTVGTIGVISKGNIGYVSDLPQNQQNIEEAKKILEEAGYKDTNNDGFRENKDGSEMKIMVSPAYSESKGNLYERLAQVVIRDMQSVGLNAYLDEEVSNADAWKARFSDKKDFQIAITGCSQGVAIIDTVNQGLVEKAGSDGTLTWNGTNADTEYVDFFSKIIDSKNQTEYAKAVENTQQYLADNMVAISLGVEDMFYPYNTEKYANWSPHSGNGVFCYDTLFSLQNNQGDAQTQANQSDTQTNHVTDVTGREVDVPSNAQNVVMLPGPAYEKAMILGVTDRVKGITKSSVTEWAKMIHPEIGPEMSGVMTFDSSSTPNIEDIVGLNAEFVICHDYADLDAEFDKINLPYVITQCSAELPYKDLEGFLAFQKTEVNAIAEAFGGDALSRAQAWCDYFDEKVAYVRERTDKLTDAERPRVYYARSDEALVTFSKNSYPQYLVELAGGNYVAKDTAEEMNSALTIEQIMQWDPEIIFMGRMDSTSAVTDNNAWSGITAVKNKQVYLCPSGVFNWDYSGESVLLMMYLAKNIHPDLFTDLDMKKEIKNYYSTFYGYDLSDANVQNILNHMAPEAQ